MHLTGLEWFNIVSQDGSQKTFLDGKGEPIPFLFLEMVIVLTKSISITKNFFLLLFALIPQLY